jgi:hypothetical protein
MPVVLRLVGGRESVHRTTVSDAQGRFRFTELPVDGSAQYLPGASHGQPRATVLIEVFDPVSHPSPLVVESHRFTVTPVRGALVVREEMVVENPSRACYIGRTADAAAEPETLHLGIPTDFERVTFDEEFFGRRFSIRNGKLTTGIPWPPGRRALNFTYVITTPRTNCVWQRTLDLPTDAVEVLVKDLAETECQCNLERVGTLPDGCIRFTPSTHPLPAGFLIRFHLGELPMSAAGYAQGVAVISLIGLITGAVLRYRYRGRRRSGPV